MKFVDFIGLPGSGKTWIAEAIVAEGCKRGANFMSSEDGLISGMQRVNHDSLYHHLVTRLPRIFLRRRIYPLFAKSNYFGHYLVQYLREFGPSLGVFLNVEDYGNLDPYSRSLTLKYFLRGASRFSLLSESLRKSDVVLFDESLTQRSVSFFSMGHAEVATSVVREYVRNIPRPDLVCFVRLSPEECVRRMERRESGVPERMRLNHDKSLLEQLTCFGQILLAAAAAHRERGVPVIEIDNGCNISPPGLTKQIIRSLSNTESDD